MTRAAPVIPAEEFRGSLKKAKARARVSEYRSQLEADYATHLDMLKSAGEIKWWAYEVISFKIGDGCWYKPDFMVVFADDSIEFHETKGYEREAGRVRLRVAAQQLWMFTFRQIKRITFKSVKSVNGRWDVTEIKTH